jgi:membrane-associated phospholipid phosphatase
VPVLALRVSEPSGVFESRPGSTAERLGERLRTHRPVVAGGVVVVVGYVVMTVLLIALGLMLTKLLDGGPVDTWDNSVNQWFVAQRTSTLNSVSSLGSALGETLTIIGIAVGVAIVLSIGRHWRELGFLLAGLTVEATTALTASTLVNQSRPNVPRLDAAPPTASFPSGHTAAAIVLYVSLAIVLSSFVRSTTLRALVWVLAITTPIFVGISRLYRGMHHPTDVMGSIVLGVGSLLFALLATRTAGEVTDLRAHEADTAESPPTTVEVLP